MIVFADKGGTENRGRATVLYRSGAAAGSMLTLTDWGGFNQLKAIFTKHSLGEAGSYQFLHTMGSSIYLYVFGDRIGQMMLGGVAFYGNCDEQNDRVGISHVIQWYREHRVAKRAAPIQVTIDPSTTFETYLLGMQGQVLDPAKRLYQFVLTMASVPPDDLVQPIVGGGQIGVVE